jgi:TPR repeat protein
MARILIATLLIACSTGGRAFAQATAEEQFDLADRYFAGDGVPMDAAAAVSWYPTRGTSPPSSSSG